MQSFLFIILIELCLFDAKQYAMSNTIPPRHLWTRRTFFKQSLLVSAVLPFGGLLRVNSNFPIVETENGRVRGMSVSGIHTFRGIPYGADTSGSNRFMPPKSPAGWSEVMDAFAYGPAAPQAPINPTDAYGQSVNWDMHVKTGISVP